MSFIKFKNNKTLKIITNVYVIISIIFVIWMFFFDENTYLNFRLNKEIKELESTINFYETKNKVINQNDTRKNGIFTPSKKGISDYRIDQMSFDSFLDQFIN